MIVPPEVYIDPGDESDENTSSCAGKIDHVLSM